MKNNTSAQDFDLANPISTNQLQNVNQTEDGHFWALNCQFKFSLEDIKQNYQELSQTLNKIQELNQDKKAQDIITVHRNRLNKAYDVLSNPQKLQKYLHNLKVRSYLNQRISDHIQDTVQDNEFSSESYIPAQKTNNNNGNGNVNFNNSSGGYQDQIINPNGRQQSNINSNVTSNAQYSFIGNTNYFTGSCYTPTLPGATNQYNNSNTNYINNNTVSPASIHSNQNNNNSQIMRKQFPFFLFETYLGDKKVATIIHFDFVSGKISEEQQGKIVKNYSFEQIYGKVYLNSSGEDFIVNLKENNMVNTYSYKAKFTTQTTYIIHLYKLAGDQCEAKKPVLKFINMKLDNFEMEYYSGENNNNSKNNKDIFFLDDHLVPVNWILKERVVVKQFWCKKKVLYLFLGYTHLIEANDSECMQILRVIPLKQAFFTFQQRKNEVHVQVLDNRKTFFFSEKKSAQNFCRNLNISLNSSRKVTCKQVHINKGLYSEQQYKKQQYAIEKLKQREIQLNDRVQAYKSSIQTIQDEGDSQEYTNAENQRLLNNLKQNTTLQTQYQNQLSPSNKFGSYTYFPNDNNSTFINNNNTRFKTHQQTILMKQMGLQHVSSNFIMNKYDSSYNFSYTGQFGTGTKLGSDQKINGEYDQDFINENYANADEHNKLKME